METLTNTQTKSFRIDVANETAKSGDGNTPENIVITIPHHVQPALDSILEHYAESGQKPQIKLCGGILDIVSDFVRQMEETLPQHLVNNGRDVMDFIIHNLCEFCREKSVTHMTFNFNFQRQTSSAGQ